MVGFDNHKNAKDNTSASNATTMDCVKNWTKSCQRDAPVAFRTPISRARVSDRAIDKLVKLKQEVIKIIPASPLKK